MGNYRMKQISSYSLFELGCLLQNCCTDSKAEKHADIKTDTKSEDENYGLWKQ